MTSPHPQRAIVQWYNSCIFSLNSICQVLRGTDSKDNPAAGSGYQRVLTLVEDQVGRLRVWAGNVGAHRTGRMSLDHKLREATHIKNAVVELLKELDDLLEEFLYEILQLREEGEDEGEDEEEEEDEDEESDSDTKFSDLIFMLNDIAHIISCLYNLSVTMRQPVPRDRVHKYAQINVSHFENFDIQHVRTKFPLAQSYLVERLGHSNTQRRQYLKYREQHHEKIAKGVEMIIAGEDGVGDREDTNTAITAAETLTTVSTVPGSTPLQTEPARKLVDDESD